MIINGRQESKLQFELIDQRKIPLSYKLQELEEIILKYNDLNLTFKTDKVSYDVKSKYSALKDLFNLINLALHLRNDYLLVSTTDLTLIYAS